MPCAHFRFQKRVHLPETAKCGVLDLHSVQDGQNERNVSASGPDPAKSPDVRFCAVRVRRRQINGVESPFGILSRRLEDRSKDLPCLEFRACGFFRRGRTARRHELPAVIHEFPGRIRRFRVVADEAHIVRRRSFVEIPIVGQTIKMVESQIHRQPAAEIDLECAGILMLMIPRRVPCSLQLDDRFLRVRFRRFAVPKPRLFHPARPHDLRTEFRAGIETQRKCVKRKIGFQCRVIHQQEKDRVVASDPVPAFPKILRLHEPGDPAERGTFWPRRNSFLDRFGLLRKFMAPRVHDLRSRCVPQNAPIIAVAIRECLTVRDPHIQEVKRHFRQITAKNALSGHAPKEKVGEILKLDPVVSIVDPLIMPRGIILPGPHRNEFFQYSPAAQPVRFRVGIVERDAHRQQVPHDLRLRSVPIHDRLAKRGPAALHLVREPEKFLLDRRLFFRIHQRKAPVVDPRGSADGDSDLTRNVEEVSIFDAPEVPDGPLDRFAPARFVASHEINERTGLKCPQQFQIVSNRLSFRPPDLNGSFRRSLNGFPDRKIFSLSQAFTDLRQDLRTHQNTRMNRRGNDFRNVVLRRFRDRRRLAARKGKTLQHDAFRQPDLQVRLSLFQPKESQPRLAVSQIPPRFYEIARTDQPVIHGKTDRNGVHLGVRDLQTLLCGSIRRSASPKPVDPIFRHLRAKHEIRLHTESLPDGLDPILKPHAFPFRQRRAFRGLDSFAVQHTEKSRKIGPGYKIHRTAHAEHDGRHQTQKHKTNHGSFPEIEQKGGKKHKPCVLKWSGNFIFAPSSFILPEPLHKVNPRPKKEEKIRKTKKRTPSKSKSNSKIENKTEQNRPIPHETARICSEIQNSRSLKRASSSASPHHLQKHCVDPPIRIQFRMKCRHELIPLTGGGDLSIHPRKNFNFRTDGLNERRTNERHGYIPKRTERLLRMKTPKLASVRIPPGRQVHRREAWLKTFGILYILRKKQKPCTRSENGHSRPDPIQKRPEKIQFMQQFPHDSTFTSGKDQTIKRLVQIPFLPDLETLHPQFLHSPFMLDERSLDCQNCRPHFICPFPPSGA